MTNAQSADNESFCQGYPEVLYEQWAMGGRKLPPQDSDEMAAIRASAKLGREMSMPRFVH